MNNLHPIARAVQSQGRGNDSQLIHMTPGEIQGLQAIAMAHGGSLSTNPTTGLPEAGFLSDILPAIAGFALGPAGFGLTTLQASMAVGGLKAITSGSLAEGISAGFGAWGGSELGGAVAGMGSGAIGGQAAANATTQAALQNKAGAGAVANAARDAAVKEATKGQMLQQGAKAFMSDPTQLVGALGGAGKTAGVFNAMGAPFAIQTATPAPEQKSAPVSVSQMKYHDNYRGPKEGEARSSGERNWYDGEYAKTGEKVYGAAGGGIMGFNGNEGSLVNPTGIKTITQMPGEAPIARKRLAPAAGKLGYSDEMTDDDGKKYRLKYDPATGKYTREYSEVVDSTVEEAAKKLAPLNDKPIQGGESISAPMTDQQAHEQQMQGDINFNTLAGLLGYGGATVEEANAAAAAVPSQAAFSFGEVGFDAGDRGQADAINEAIQSGAMAQGTAEDSGDVDGSSSSGNINASPDAGLGGPSGGGHDAGITGTNSFSAPDGDGYNEAAGGLISLARGGALRFAQAGSVPDTRFYAQPTQNAMGNEVPDQAAQALAAAELQRQQLSNQATEFVSPSAMMPNTRQYTSPAGIASGYATDYTKATPETVQTGLASLRPETRELPGGFSGYGQDAFVASRPPVNPASMGGGTAVTPGTKTVTTPGGVTTDGATKTKLTREDVNFAKLYADADQFAIDNPGKTGADYIQLAGDTNEFGQTDIDAAISGYSANTALTALPTSTAGATSTYTAPSQQMSDDFRVAAGAKNVLGPLMLAAAKDFFNSEAGKDPATVVLAAQGNNLNAEQMASAWAASTGGSYTEGLASIQNYLAANPDVKLGDGSGGKYKKGGLLSLAAGGMAKGAFVLPADVVSMAGGGSTEAGLRSLTRLLGNVQPIKGGGTGLSDSIATNIDGRQPARVADGEAYLDPTTVAKIGGGNHNNGAKKLYAMMNNIRQQAHGKTSQQREVNPAKALKG